MEIIKASEAHLGLILPLFDGYRVFYGMPSNKKASRKFLTDRFNNGENIIFLARDNNTPLGFTQLYKTFSSVSLEPYFILNDLFVDQNHRNKGIAKALLKRAKEYCVQMNYKGLALETATDNPAQKLYEKLDWKLDQSYLHYFWTNPKE